MYKKNCFYCRECQLQPGSNKFTLPESSKDCDTQFITQYSIFLKICWLGLLFPINSGNTNLPKKLQSKKDYMSTLCILAWKQNIPAKPSWPTNNFCHALPWSLMFVALRHIIKILPERTFMKYIFYEAILFTYFFLVQVWWQCKMGLSDMPEWA